MKHFYLIFLYVIIFSCNSPEKKITTSHINKKIDSTIFLLANNSSAFGNRNYLTVDYFDKFYNNVSVSEILDSNINIKRKIIAYEPVILRGVDYRDNLTYVLLPGDSLTIYLDENQLLSLKSLKDSSRNKELNFFNALRINEPSMAYFKLGKTISNKGFQNDFNRDIGILYTEPDLGLRAKYAFQKYQDQLDFLDTYDKKNNLRRETYKIFKELFYYNYMYTKIKIVTTLLKTNKPIDENLNMELTDFRSRINMADSYYNLFFRLTIKNYLEYLLIKNKISEKVKNEFIIKEFDGNTRDFLLFTETKMALEQQSYNESVINFFYANCTNSAYKNEIKNIAQLSIPTKESVLVTHQNKRIIFNDLIKENQGNVLYIDFWASWCVPCIQQIPSSIALEKQFINLPIKFYYISLDKSNTPWKAMSSHLKLPINKDFLLVNDFSSPLAKSLKITSIPRHIIFNKKGVLVSRDAESPLDDNLKSYLLRLAKE